MTPGTSPNLEASAAHTFWQSYRSSHGRIVPAAGDFGTRSLLMLLTDLYLHKTYVGMPISMFAVYAHGTHFALTVFVGTLITEWAGVSLDAGAVADRLLVFGRW